jgi:hypothetical protein
MNVLSRLFLFCAAVIVNVGLLQPVQTFANTLLPSNPADRVLFIGQDLDTINQYVAALGSVQTPAGVVEYLDLAPSAQDGKLDVLAANYSSSALSVGLPLIGQLQQVVNGQWDGRLKAIIQKLKNYNRPIYFRLGHEFEGDWNAYDPLLYQTAWRRVSQLIQQLNAQRHIAMVWQAAAHCGTTFGLRPLDAWYPGDRWVDIVGLSYFTPGAIGAPDRGTCVVANQRINEVAAFAKQHGKPLMVAESTPRGYHIANETWRNTGYGVQPSAVKVPVTDMVLWYQNWFNWIAQHNVQLVSYIDAFWDNQPMWGPPYVHEYWGDARVQANGVIRTIWLNQTAKYLKANSGVASKVGFSAGTHSIMVRAKGTTGQEIVSLKVNGITLKTWSLGASVTETVVQTALNGVVTLHFQNDAPARDVQVDYVNIDGHVRQAKHQTMNTGVYQGGQCGGQGRNGWGQSEWLHCNGYIDFGRTDVVLPQPVEIVVRAKGTTGNEQVELWVGSALVRRWTLSAQMADMAIATPASSQDVLLRYVNDGQNAAGDVQVDYIKVNDDVRQAEWAPINSGVFQGGQCGGSGAGGIRGMSEWLHCNGAINFGSMQPL